MDISVVVVRDVARTDLAAITAVRLRLDEARSSVWNFDVGDASASDVPARLKSPEPSRAVEAGPSPSRLHAHEG